ncbi:MAG: GYD domain-containing protein [Ilumatobacteraceae bacterium]
MGTYISLVDWTEHGVKDVKSTIERLDSGLELAGSYGVTPLHTFWTVGPHDMVFIAEAPDDESITAYLLDVCSRGAIRTTTMRAFDRDGMSRVLERLVGNERP